MIFYEKETKKMIELVARPGRRLAVAPNGQGGLEVVAEVVLRPQHPFEGNPNWQQAPEALLKLGKNKTVTLKITFLGGGRIRIPPWKE